jgi:hypothetical protein
MLSFAMDNPSSSTTIVLISASFNLAYPMSVLRMRRYHLVLISPIENTDRYLKYQASEFVQMRVPVGGAKSMSADGIGWSGNANRWRDEWTEGSVKSSGFSVEIEKQDLDTVTPSSPSGSSQVYIFVSFRIFICLNILSPLYVK